MKKCFILLTGIIFILSIGCKTDDPQITLNNGYQIEELPESGSVDELPLDLQTFINEIDTALEKHQWDTIIDMADPEHYQIQVVELEQSHDRYIVELIGAGYVDNNIDPDPTITSAYPSVDQIKTVEFTEWARFDNEIKVTGKLTTNKNQKISVEITIINYYGEYKLTGAIG